MDKPIIAITMGDAGGIGPEIIVKLFKRQDIFNHCVPVVIGDEKILKKAEKDLQTGVHIDKVDRIDTLTNKAGRMPCLDLNILPNDLPKGEVSASAGDAAFRFIEKAVELANLGKINGICTAPLNKEALHKGGHLYPGHTEILADLTDTDDFAMMLSATNLKVIHVTTHVGLLEAVRRIDDNRVYSVVKMAHETLVRAGISQPKIGVCGINPHAGENGLFGEGEEEEKIVPAIERARSGGIEVTGPFPADTLFFRATRGDFDIVVAMYHDQGHGPIKVLGLDNGVNITVGLPIIRTSVDHGTAFDIAGKGVASEDSLIEALLQAAELAGTNVK
ncbi:4-hydroxythreonine-4-phosphate dehydrogenase PdxA [Salicibibacter cibi]|uniref:4-hydroxythreonine-4-phosphate dehydrogenase PdxA n=1 Tax=Salicibibacter cibi TaxID=2743001 RepID=A0A7T6Z8X9_9BACI|nr:4-hydroxythreonine-4-phosphate dehydrogenase PdxA [Salicibibacter cibi]QQK78897.1 4-hydroxythreonine-4-phosphate dehydrogenase PdxA [Salicibibacter cibi]